jgi:hypothetical protein
MHNNPLRTEPIRCRGSHHSAQAVIPHLAHRDKPGPLNRINFIYAFGVTEEKTACRSSPSPELWSVRSHPHTVSTLYYQCKRPWGAARPCAVIERETSRALRQFRGGKVADFGEICGSEVQPATATRRVGREKAQPPGRRCAINGLVDLCLFW